MPSVGDTTTLRLEGIRKSYALGTKAETEVLHGIDLTIQRGEFTALIGPSGSGKSTLLNLIGLLDRPTTREGRPAVAHPHRRRLRAGPTRSDSFSEKLSGASAC